ncbi:chaoptin [Agrilus planipennis]|uniref:Chaoptin n=1 Tax=Agrilus planipennis TaxID=224129 RepID=A0A1W4WDR3_AGRPL|nr:chaoptin [Agrilus planipennis]
MDLEVLLRFVYALIVGCVVLMMWISLGSARNIEAVNYPPCYFNPLCSCSKAIPDLGIVRCQDVSLPRIPDTINSSKVFMLHMENNGLRHIEPYFFQNTGLYRISIIHNPLSYLPDEAFAGLERSMWELDLSHNELVEVPTRALKYLQKLTHLDLTGNFIFEIRSDTWRGLEDSLEVLILADNSISRLPLDAFSGLPLLDTIDLTGNNLHEIDPSVFRDGMGRLAHLILKDNQLSAIPYEALSPLKMLRTLDLSYNRIKKMEPANYNENTKYSYKFSLDTFRLDFNQIEELETDSFQFFGVLNRTFLDGNPIKFVEQNAFRPAKIKELYMRGCEINEISPLAFDGLENSLHVLDLSGNNITALHHEIFHRFDVLRTVSLKDNLITDFNPVETFNGFQYTLYKLDISGTKNALISIQDLRRLRNLRVLSLSRLQQSHLSPENFLEFGTDLEELQINYGDLRSIKSHAFQSVHGLRRIDLSENRIDTIDKDAFADIGHSLVSLKLSHALSSSISQIPAESFGSLTNLEDLDLSFNRIQTMPDNCFHFMKKLKILQLQDNLIDKVQKGTFQGDLHSELEIIYMSFNNLKTIQQHTFTDLSLLEQLHLDDNKIENLERRAFMNLNKLKRLNLKGNKIASISYEAFQNLPDLEDLDMSYNKISKFEFAIFDQVGTLSMFKVNMSHNSITRLGSDNPLSFTRDSAMGTMHSTIKVLDLSYNNITRVGMRFFHPVEMSLTYLHMSHNNLRNCTKDIFGNMIHLQLLDLSYNNIYEVDYDTFKSSHNLQEIFFHHNEIMDIPKDLFRNLKNLRVVDLSFNRLRLLPDNLFKEDDLEKLDLSGNDFNRFPFNSFSLAAASTLCELDLSHNSISTLAHNEALGKFKNLIFLDLSYNRLVQLELAAFSFLPKLLALDLSHNSQLVLERNGHSFQGLEDSLLHLKLDNVSFIQVPEMPLPNLLTLSMAYNSLPNIPQEVASNLTSLRRLNLAHNDLTTVPLVTHSFKQITHLSLAGNPITVLSNTSLLGIGDHLEELDVREMELTTLETGAFCKMKALETLKISDYKNVKDFNIPTLIEKNVGLRNLEIQVEKESNLEKEMRGVLPSKIRNITFTGRGLKKISSYILQGVRSPFLHLSFYNTSLNSIPDDLFLNLGWARNVTIDVRNNGNLQKLENPSTGSRPGLPGQTFLLDVWMSGNKWNCDCNLGWVEFWQRKRRQYLCQHPNNNHFENTQEYNCRHVEDDLRLSKCSNRNNESLIEILKSDIECGWSSASKISSSFFTLCLFSLFSLRFIFN